MNIGCSKKFYKLMNYMNYKDNSVDTTFIKAKKKKVKLYGWQKKIHLINSFFKH